MVTFKKLMAAIAADPEYGHKDAKAQPAESAEEFLEERC